MKAGKYQDYQKQSRQTWGPVDVAHPITYPTLGLLNEAGELAGKVKKILRDKNKEISPEDKKALIGELGDVLWYFAQICNELDITIEEVAEKNLDKLADRQNRGVLKGDGDDR